MDHDETREQLDLAALEPGGIERLMAGDTPMAQAVAAHLVGCPACSDELLRLERASHVIRSAVRELAPADLRERTIAAVRAQGVPRGRSAAAAASVPAAAAMAAAPLVPAAPRRRVLGWVAAIAAAVVLSVVATSLIVGSRIDEGLAAQAKSIAALQQVTLATLHISAEPDAEHVQLAGPTNPGLAGSLVFSSSTTQLSVVATGLTPPPAGFEYRCWVEVNGSRERVGKMFFSGGLAYWVGPAPAISGIGGGARFGVSLVEIGGGTLDAEPVLIGALGAGAQSWVGSPSGGGAIFASSGGGPVIAPSGGGASR